MHLLVRRAGNIRARQIALPKKKRLGKSGLTTARRFTHKLLCVNRAEKNEKAYEIRPISINKKRDALEHSRFRLEAPASREAP
jgi:hypothetical protein